MSSAHSSKAKVRHGQQQSQGITRHKENYGWNARHQGTNQGSHTDWRTQDKELSDLKPLKMGKMEHE